MEKHNHSLNNLFAQLGLASTDKDIETFVKQHKPIESDVVLHQANIWTASQASFLQQSKDDDADWAEIVDQLDAMLR
ncbi:DUF2789 domain-containing protein [Pseudocolwellia agarivorans]|uniref:DUF2789 domain-containing protein n=1 Tax=Pseudocolwellia agarivorans TaxID=1911682 RepID=UPI000985C770|nr:DUF2789 domain-containing protein [Pseudocolwellia agarivorans]